MYLLLLIGLVLTMPVFADNALGLPSLNIPTNNPQSEEKISLGRDFFHDSRFSLDGSISCASCHQPEKAWTDGLTVAQGVNGRTGTRNTPTIINAAFFETLFVDGREISMEGQALGPLLNPVEHGLDNKQKILDVVLNDATYSKRVQKVFGISRQAIAVEHIAKAIASFERTLITGNSAFDQYYFARNKSKLSASAARGLLIFRRKGNCANCHEISWNNALFSDNRFYNIGIGFNKIQSFMDKFIQSLTNSKNSNPLTLSNKQRSELGRFNVTQVIADIGKFKTPTLRNIALTAPYMHDGSIQTLEQVVEYYDKGGDKNRFIDVAIFPLHLSSQEKADLVAFMKSLTSWQYARKPAFRRIQ